MKEKRKGLKYRKHGFFVAALILLAILFSQTGKKEEIDFLDVGQGDAVYICTAEGMSMFIDGGSTSVKKAGQNRILPFLKYHGIRQISYWFISHADEDHISGFVEIMEAGYPVQYLVIAKGAKQDEKMKELICLARQKGTKVLYLDEGDGLKAGKTKITCLSSAKQISEDRNENCLILLYESGEKKALFAGDIPENVEKKLIGKYENLLRGIEVFKADHHGSNYSNSREFLEVLSPQIAVISCAEKNKYGHPGKLAEENMLQAGAQIYYTMRAGQIKLHIEKNGRYSVRGKME